MITRLTRPWADMWARALALVCLLVLSAAGLLAPVQASELWFAPNDNLPRGIAHDIVLNQDFPHLFDEPPTWSLGVDVFEISPYVSRTPDAAKIGSFLDAHHIKLSVGVLGTMADNPSPCGNGIEGMSFPTASAKIFAQLKKLGVRVDSVALDEPLTFGHYSARGCKYSIEELAARVARTVAEIRVSYPQIRVVDNEALPPSDVSSDQWAADLRAFLRYYRRDTGSSLDGMIFDTDLINRDWTAMVRTGVRVSRSVGVRPGIFAIKMGSGMSDADAVMQYQRAISAISASRIHFDIVNIANWTPSPFANLPPDEPTTMTYVVDWFNAHRLH